MRSVFCWVAAFLFAGHLCADPIVVPSTFVSGTPANAAAVNANFKAVVDGVNDLDARIAAIEFSGSSAAKDQLLCGHNLSAGIVGYDPATTRIDCHQYGNGTAVKRSLFVAEIAAEGWRIKQVSGNDNAAAILYEK